MATKLPKRMHLKHGRYYYVHQNKWHPLSRELPEALRQYADRISQDSGNVLQQDLAAAIVKAESRLAPNTLRGYRHSADIIADAFQEFHPRQVEPHHVATFLDSCASTPGMANRHRNVLILLFKEAIRAGHATFNPVKDIAPFPTKTRDRYITPDEFKAVKAHACPALACMMDIAYMTGQRVSDVRLMKLADISDAGVYVKQGKTGNKLLLEMTADLRETIAAAKSLHTNVRGLTLFHNRKGAPWSPAAVGKWWRAACASAGVTGATFHDIRAAAGTDAKKAGLDAKALLGHRSDSAHMRYMRDKEVPIVTPNRKRS